MAQDNKLIYVDEEAIYREQGTQYAFLPDRKMYYAMGLPNCKYLVPQDFYLSDEAAEKKAKTTKKTIEDVRTDAVIDFIKGRCDAGRAEVKLRNKKAHSNAGTNYNRKAFSQHFGTGMKMQNSLENFDQYPVLLYSMVFDFDSNLNLRQLISDFKVEEIQKPERICFTKTEINQSQKPSKYLRLGENTSHVSMMFAYGFCCNQNPIMNQALNRAKFRTNDISTFADGLVYHQGYAARRKAPFYAFENNIPIFVNIPTKQSNNIPIKYEVVQDVAARSAISFCSAALTNPMSCPWALVDGWQFAAAEATQQSSLGQTEVVDKSFTLEEMRLLNKKMQKFKVNYNATYDASSKPDQKPMVA